MYLNIIFLPLFGALISGVFGRVIGPLGSGFITLICVSFSLVLSFFAFYEVGFLLSPCFIQLLT